MARAFAPVASVVAIINGHMPRSCYSLGHGIPHQTGAQLMSTLIVQIKLLPSRYEIIYKKRHIIHIYIYAKHYSTPIRTTKPTTNLKKSNENNACLKHSLDKATVG
jgi:hypothetical protein